MNKINKLFREKKKEILSIYFTAGFPQLEDTNRIIDELISAGSDMIEIGIPFSDPLADGPVIQHSSEVALKNGMSLKLLFTQLQISNSKRKTTNVPLLLMGYLNPVLQFGLENFLQACSETGIDGVILPDLPLSEYEKHYQSSFQQYGINNIFLVTPQTSEARVRKIDEISDAFIYLVSSNSTTGTKQVFSEEQIKYFERIKNYKLKNPTLVGFGISDKKGFEKACTFANGAIIGSAFIRCIAQNQDLKISISNFINKIK